MKIEVKILQVRLVDNAQSVLCELKYQGKTERKNFTVGLDLTQQEIIDAITAEVTKMKASLVNSKFEVNS